MPQFERSAKKIYKNTIFLYVRMLFIMVVSLYASRLTLEYLGISDFGIYNVVAGVITVLSFLSNSMALSVNRFLSYEMGVGDTEKLQDVFSLSIKIHILIALIVIVGGETIGLWLVNNKLVIPADRVEAANYIYQFSIVAFIFTVLRVPYNAAIIAHENMKIFSYMGIIEGVLRLGIVVSLKYILFDKLIVYGLLFAILTIGVSLFYYLYCINKYEECYYKSTNSPGLFKEMLAYAGISTFGNLSTVVLDQGQNILLNVFFGPIVNAARGVAYQVNSALSSFVSNIYTAATPQITMSYGAKDKEYMTKIVNETTILSMVILSVLIVPIIINMQFILVLWLGADSVPADSALFCCYILICTMLSNCCRPILIAIQSSGDIWRMHLYTGLIVIANIPVDYFLLKVWNVPAYVVFVVYFVSLFFFVATVLVLSKKQLNWNIHYYLFRILVPLFALFILSIVASMAIEGLMIHTYFKIIAQVFLSAFIMCGGAYCFMLDKGTRAAVWNFIVNRLKK